MSPFCHMLPPLDLVPQAPIDCVQFKTFPVLVLQLALMISNAVHVSSFWENPVANPNPELCVADWEVGANHFGFTDHRYSKFISLDLAFPCYLTLFTLLTVIMEGHFH